MKLLWIPGFAGMTSGTPHSGQPDHFAGPTRQNDLPWTANGQGSFNKLAR
jgi:hypothetical protein